MQLTRGIGQHRYSERGVYKGSEIDLPQRNEESRVDRQQQQEIQFASAHQLGEGGAVDEEECLVNLLNEMAPADQHHDLPLGPCADVVGMQVEDTDEAELQAKPKKLHKYPEQEVALEAHFARDRVLP